MKQFSSLLQMVSWAKLFSRLLVSVRTTDPEEVELGDPMNVVTLRTSLFFSPNAQSLCCHLSA